MNKTEAIRLLGGSPSTAAQAVGVTVSAVLQWPDELPARIADRVQAALWRMAQGRVAPAKTPDEPTKAAV